MLFDVRLEVPETGGILDIIIMSLNYHIQLMQHHSSWRTKSWGSAEGELRWAANFSEKHLWNTFICHCKLYNRSNLQVWIWKHATESCCLITEGTQWIAGYQQAKSEWKSDFFLKNLKSSYWVFLWCMRSWCAKGSGWCYCEAIFNILGIIISANNLSHWERYLRTRKQISFWCSRRSRKKTLGATSWSVSPWYLGRWSSI